MSVVSDMKILRAPLRHNLERMISVVKRNRKIRNYIRAIMALYFSPEVDDDVWLAMHSMAAKSNLHWLRGIEASRQLQPWVKTEQLADDIVRYEYATINDWAQGRISDADIVPRARHRLSQLHARRDQGRGTQGD